MNIAGTEYTLKYQSLDIYISGCRPPHCKGCHNPDYWDFNIGVDYQDGGLEAIGTKIVKSNGMIQNIMIFGGEPLDTPTAELVNFLRNMKTFRLPIWLFTRYDIDVVPVEIQDLCDFIKTGEYIEEKTVDNHEEHGILLATSNQHVLKKGVDYGESEEGS